ncbi:MAG: endonuclease/exonuclease/phosphatase family protein [Gammaproteobacteria bacterium]
MIKRLWIVSLAVSLFGCAVAPESLTTQQQSVSIMTFNVENLFDAQHDEGKDDYTYLAVAQKQTPEHKARCASITVRSWRDQCLDLDWSETSVRLKLEALASSILANSDDGRGPDILVLQEVENAAILDRLRLDHLSAAGYGPAVLVEGDDARGIDVAFLSRLPVRGEPRLHRIRFANIEARAERDTRGILQATFEMPDGALITGFAVHFPAPFHPPQLRVESYAALASLLRALPSGRAAFAAGDFNTVTAERWILDQHVARDWTLAHLAGCTDCRGTYYYAPNDDWSFLDMILVNPSLSAGGSTGWALDPSRTRVARAWPQQSKPDGTPRRFDVASGLGVSDHWPLSIQLRRAQN